MDTAAVAFISSKCRHVEFCVCRAGMPLEKKDVPQLKKKRIFLTVLSPVVTPQCNKLFVSGTTNSATNELGCADNKLSRCTASNWFGLLRNLHLVALTFQIFMRVLGKSAGKIERLNFQCHLINRARKRVRHAKQKTGSETENISCSSSAQTDNEIR